MSSSRYTEQIFEFAKTQKNKIYHISVIENNICTTKCITPSNLTNDCYSVSKAFTVTALGMLYDEGKLDTDERIIDILKKDVPKSIDEKWSEITVHDVLLHRWGLYNGFLDIDCEDINTYFEKYGTRNDFLKIIFSTELKSPIGGKKCYSDAAYYLLSRVVSERSGETTYDYLRKRLFVPLSFEETAWSTCPQGYSMGATGLFLRSSDMVKLPALYMNGGILNGNKVISKEWCDIVLERGYELERFGHGGYAKGGMYGQWVCFYPAKSLAVAWLGYDETCSNHDNVMFVDNLD